MSGPTELRFHKRDTVTLTSTLNEEKKYKSLKKLEFHRCDLVYGIAYLADSPYLTNLEYLRIYDTSFMDGSLGQLLSAQWLKNLKTIYLGEFSGNRGISKLLERTDMNQLESLTFYRTYSGDVIEFIDQLVEFLTHCKIKHLGLPKTIYSGSELKYFLEKLSQSEVLASIESLNLCAYQIGGSRNREWYQKEIQMVRDSVYCNPNLEILMDFNVAV